MKIISMLGIVENNEQNFGVCVKIITVVFVLLRSQGLKMAEQKHEVDLYI